MNTRVISAFPGMGKSYLCENQEELGLIILDSDSSKFSWTITDNGRVRNPEFPVNYIKHIKDNIGKCDIILVSTHETVRNALCKAHINYDIYYPSKSMNKNSYIKRLRQRGSDDAFCDLIDNNWKNWIDDISNDDYPTHYPIYTDMYLFDIIKEGM